VRRREFILGSACAIVLPTSGNAQTRAVPVVGYLSSKSEAAEIGIVAGVKKGLAQFGFVDGSNVLMTYRWSGGNYDRLAEFVTELIRNNVDIIVTSGLPATLAAKAATTTIPVVFRLAVDPVAFALADSFDHPGKNLTGVTMMFDPLTPKKLQLLHEMVPSPSVGLLVNPKNPNAASHREHADAAARPLGLQLSILTASSGAEIEPAFATARRNRVAAVLVGDDPLFDSESATLVQAAATHRMPTMYYVRDFVQAGGLISYGPSFDEMAEQVGQYLGRIFKGAKPADLPIQQPTRFELVVNTRTANALQLAIPPTLLAAADQVFE
jgi:putative ABC transport system substrate-binding protein